jgi:outer membrane protein OmpA-like peptidoglycan-associated protein
LNKLILKIIIILVVQSFLFAQNENTTGNEYISPAVFGFYADYNLNSDKANFQKLPNIPNCCPQFDKGSGTGFSLGLSMEYLLPYSLRIGLRGGVSILNSTLSKDEYTLVRIADTVGDGVFRHSLVAKIMDIGIEPYLSYNPIFGINLYGGGRFGFVAQKDFSQEERIIEPSDRGVFIDTHTRVRNNISGTIPDAAGIYASIMAGISYDLPLNSNKSLFICPEIFYHLGLTNIVKNLDWKISSLKLGLSIKFQPLHKPPEPIEEFRNETFIDTVIAESVYEPDSVIKAGSPLISNRDERHGDTTFHIQSLRRTDTSFFKPKLKAILSVNTPTIKLNINNVMVANPLLPVIFFEKNSATLTDYYSTLKDKNNFKIDSLGNDIIDVNKNILNIIGKRLEANPEATIRVRGYVDFDREKRDCLLAQNRAQIVKQYLVNVWSIDENRIKDLTNEHDCTPESTPLDRSDTAAAENRRVEIYSSEPEIFIPVLVTRFKDTTNYEMSGLELDPSRSIMKNIKSWSIECLQNENAIFKLEGEGNPDKMTKSLDKDVIKKILNNRQLELLLTLEDVSGRTVNDKVPLNVDEYKEEKESDFVFSVLFGLAKDRLDERAKGEIEYYIKNLPKNTSLTVSGYSDIIGGEKKNNELSINRARNAADYIKKINPGINIESVSSLSFNKFRPGINSFSTPSERYLSRTVLIEIRR